MNQERLTEEDSPILVRNLRLEDLEDVIRIDARSFGRPRRDYFRIKLEKALSDTSVRVSFAAELEGVTVGFLMGSVYYGDYGLPEPSATLDAIGVLPDFARRGVARALWRQFALNLKAMRIDRVRTEVDWTSWELMSFFRKVGFGPSSRLCIEKTLNFEGDD